MRKTMFIAGLLFIAWILLGQAGSRLFMTHNPQTAARETPVSSDSVAQHPAFQDMLKEKDEQIAELRNHIDQLDARLKTFEDVLAASPKPAGPSVDNEQVARLEQKLKQQEEALSALKAQLSEVRAGATRQLSALTVLGQLKDAIVRGEPFAAQLEQMNQLTRDKAKAQELLAQLKPDAETGAITLPKLQGQFTIALPKALAAGQQGNPLMQNLQSLILIRKVGEQPGSDDESILARAEARLKRGDVDATCKELAALSPPAATAFAPWVGNAQTFLHIRNSIEALQLALIDDKPEPAPTPEPPAAAAAEPKK